MFTRQADNFTVNFFSEKLIPGEQVLFQLHRIILLRNFAQPTFEKKNNELIPFLHPQYYKDGYDIIGMKKKIVNQNENTQTPTEILSLIRPVCCFTWNNETTLYFGLSGKDTEL